MPAESEMVTSGYQPGSPRQRFVSSILSGGLILIALLLAIYQTGLVPQLVEKTTSLTTFDVVDHDRDKGGEKPEKPKQREEKKTEKTSQAKVVQEKVPPTPPVVKPVEEKPAFTFLKLSRQEFAAADIGKMKGPEPAQGSAAPSGGSGGTYGPGEGPGGATLYNADWFRRPTDAQLGGYLPENRPRSGWGMIACQTIEHYKVENCQILGESPRGSGFGRAVLNAAWQFEVLPPRINGKQQLGTWVRIRIDYGTKGDI
jgi:protein TonB